MRRIAGVRSTAVTVREKAGCNEEVGFLSREWCGVGHPERFAFDDCSFEGEGVNRRFWVK